MPQKRLPFAGRSTEGVDHAFLSKVVAAATASGATMIRVNSGRRTRETNTGVPNSNHLYGHALDGSGYVPGTGWVPLGTLLKDVGAAYGLRSGDQPGFYKGKPDIAHVDDGFNINGGKPLPASAAPTAAPAAQAEPQAPAAAAAPVAGDVPTVTPPASQGVPMPGSENHVLPGTQYTDTWQAVAQLPDLHPDTQRFIQLAGGLGAA